MIELLKSPCDAGVIHASNPVAPAMPISKPWVLAATIIGSSMAFIDGTVVNVALPVLQRDLNASATAALWVIEAYALLLAALILVGGALGDLLGRRKVYAVGIALFTLASVACGLAQNINQLIAARAVQGVGGALLVPGSLSIIGASFSGAARGRAIGTWSGATSITAAVGPVIGGWLVEHVSWRAVFVINLPLAAIVLLLVWRYVPESRDENAMRLDWAGAALATVGLGALVFGLIESSSLGMGSARVLAALVIGVLALAAFVVLEARRDHPMVPLGLFRSRTFSGANLLTLLLYGALGGALYYVPFNVQQVQGYGPTAAGAVLLPMVLIIALLSRWAGGLVGRYGARRPLVIGPLIAALGFGLFARVGIGGAYWTTFFPATVVLGLGMAITVAPLTTTVMNAVQGHRSGVASGINNAISRVASLLALATLGLVMTFSFNGSLDARLSAIPLTPAQQTQLTAQRSRLAAIEAPRDLDAQTTQALNRAIDEAFVAGFRAVMLIAAGLALLSAASAALLIADTPAVQPTASSQTPAPVDS